MRNNHQKRCSGVAMILLTTMVATVLVPLVGLAIDGTIVWMIKVKLVAAADSAALAGARSLSAGMDLASQQASAQATAISYFNANFPAGYWNTQHSVVTATAAQTALMTRTVTIQASVVSPLYFLRILGFQTQTIATQSQTSRRDVNVELVLDRSSSMSGAMTAMLAAARTFIAQFAEGRDNVGLIVFGGAAVLAFPNPSPSGPQSNFKSATPSVDTLISETVNGGNTGTAQALNMAYNELVKKNDPGALNLIVFYTDGLPNGVVANYNDATKDAGGNLTNNYIKVGHCTHRGDPAYPMLGFTSQTNGFTQNSNGADTNGVKNLTLSTVSNVSEGALGSPTNAGCSYASGETKIRQDLSQLPPLDFFGNQLGTGYAGPVSLATAINVPYTFGLAALNAADNQVLAIRKNTNLTPVIYTIGYFGGTEAPNQAWLQRIANDPSSASFDVTYPAGLFVKAPTTDQLMAAFNRVASEILRLSM